MIKAILLTLLLLVVAFVCALLLIATAMALGEKPEEDDEPNQN